MGRKGKIIASLILAGITGGTGVSSYYLSNSPQEEEEEFDEEIIDELPQIKTVSISQKLGEVGYQVLKTEGKKDDEQWNILLEAYNKSKKKKDKFAINQITKKENLKKQCQKALSSDTDINYSLAKRWCVKPETISDMLKRNNYRKLNPSSKGPDREQWRKKINSIKTNSEEQEKMGLKLNGNKDDMTLLQSACKKLRIILSKTYENKDFEEHYTQAKSWCSERNI